MCRRFQDRFQCRDRIPSPGVVVQIEASWSKWSVVVQNGASWSKVAGAGGWWTGARARTPLERLRYAPWVPERCSLLGGSEVRPSESAESSGAAEAPTRAHKPSPRPHPLHLHPNLNHPSLSVAAATLKPGRSASSFDLTQLPAYTTLSAAALCPLPLGPPGARHRGGRVRRSNGLPAPPAPGAQLLLRAQHVSVRRHLALLGPRYRTRLPRSTPGAPLAAPPPHVRACQPRHTPHASISHQLATLPYPRAACTAARPPHPSRPLVREITCSTLPRMWWAGSDMTRE